MKRTIGAAALLSLVGFANVASAGVIEISGHITQSTQDGTGPAIDNPSLANIADGDFWRVALAFDGSIVAPGTYNNVTNASLTFSDPAAGAVEASFGFISLTIADVGGFDQFSLFGCLTTGSACASGNQFTASFQIPDSGLNVFGKNLGGNLCNNALCP